MTSIFQCQSCRHYWGMGHCEAFNGQIPEEIIRGDFDHAEPHEGDNGIRYEARP